MRKKNQNHPESIIRFLKYLFQKQMRDFQFTIIVLIQNFKIKIIIMMALMKIKVLKVIRIWKIKIKITCKLFSLLIAMKTLVEYLQTEDHFQRICLMSLLKTIFFKKQINNSLNQFPRLVVTQAICLIKTMMIVHQDQI